MMRWVEVRPGVYHDSVTLMLVSQALTDDPAVSRALVAMGTALNLELLADGGYELSAEVGAGDLVIAADVDDADRDRIRALVDRLLAQSGRDPTAAAGQEGPARSIRTAAGQAGATVTLISVPGPHAFRAAMEAVEAGTHPIIFSDNVPLDQEVAIKRAATEAGLVVMGPDCGTVILDGVGLGFANAVVPGPLGLVSASGTGAQQVCVLADLAGVGVRHVVGLGGRDLSDAVGGLSALPALRLLDADPAVEVIGIIAKEIGPTTRSRLDQARAELATPTVIVGIDDLTAGTAELLAAAGAGLPEPQRWSPAATRPPQAGRVVGLYSGGTLAAEAQAVLAAAGLTGDAVDIIDLGDDTYTRGRPHPMIDDRLRLERLTAAGADPSVGAILLDVVLGHGSLADPAAALAPVIAATETPVHVALIGTADDPQDRDAQGRVLADAGAEVTLSNAAAARAASRAAAQEVRS